MWKQFKCQITEFHLNSGDIQEMPISSPNLLLVFYFEIFDDHL